jgi:photosystem II stability/assembly factor-like uncharacterized protein
MMMKHTLQLFLLLSASVTSAQQWELVTPIKTRSEFEAIEMVSDAVGYAVDKPLGTILRTHDGGGSWERMANNLSNSPVALFMWDDLRGIVVGEGGQVYRTSDGFETITGAQNPTFGELSCVYFVNDTLGWAGSLTGKIFRSTDGGASWAQMNSGQPTSNFITAIQFLDTQTGYASCSGGEMLKSTDGGLTWQSVGPFDQLVLPRDLHFYNEQLGVAVGSAGEVIRTTDGGATWDSIPSNTTYTMRDLDVQGNTMVACGDFGRTIRSTNGGLTWTVVQVGNTNHQSVSLTSSGWGLLGTDGRIQRTSDFGATWEVLVEGTWHTRINKVSFANGDTGVAVGWQTMGGFESGTLRTLDGGRHWEKAGLGGLGIHLTPSGVGSRGAAITNDFFATSTVNQAPNMAIRCTWSFDANTHIVAGGAVLGGIYRTINGGQNWTHVLNVGNITINDLWFVDDQQGYAVGEYGDNYRTIDGGITWTPLPPMSGSHTVFFLDTQLGWTRNFRTTDGGDTWTLMGGTPQQTMSIFFTDPDTGYAVSYTGQTVRSVDGGVTWSNLLPDILNATVGDAAWVDGAIVIGCNNGDIFRAQVSCPSTAEVPVINETGTSLCVSTTGSAQWYLNGDPIVDGDTPCIVPDTPGSYTVIVTDALGCLSAPSVPVQVISTGLMLPSNLGTRLFPNPVRDAIRIERMDASPALMTLLDAQGRLVRTERINTHSATLDVSGLVPGIYVIRMTGTAGVDALRFFKE